LIRSQKSEDRRQRFRLPFTARNRCRARGCVKRCGMPPLTYANYLDLEKLLTLQKACSTPAEHDEALLIIRHKYELWFTILAPFITEICSGVPKNVTINRIRESFLF
jgi:hypothetical protein